MAALLNYFDNLESGLCVRVNRYARTNALCRFFSVVSRLGDGYWWAMVGAVCLVAGGDDAPLFLLRAGLTGAVGIAIYKLLKKRLVRERPYVSHVGIACGTAPLDRYSFPSGHTLHAVSFTVMFASYDPVLLAITLPFALLVAASRVVLGLHYPSDVLVGAAIGGLLATASNALA